MQYLCAFKSMASRLPRCALLVMLLLAGGTSVLAQEAPLVHEEPSAQAEASAEKQPLERNVLSDAAWRKAYADQHDAMLIRLAGQRPAGFKAGLTSSAGQKMFNSDRAVYGVLPPNTKIASEKPIQLSDFGRGMIELEMAFRVKQTVNSEIADVPSLTALLADVAPAFELPDLGLLRNPAEGALGIVRANTAAHSFVVGEAKSMKDLVSTKGFNIDSLAVKLRCNDDEILSAASGDLLGGQWQNLLKLINDRVAQGWIIYPDQWLLTGAIGQMLPLQAGRCEGEISGLGNLAINVLP